jgi:hypothetical protein
MIHFVTPAPPASALAIQNRTLIIILICAFIGQAVLATVLTVVGIRRISRANAVLAARYEQLRTEALQEYVRTQKEETARLIADTRAATAKMNVMADALWEGLRDPRDPTG